MIVKSESLKELFLLSKLTLLTLSTSFILSVTTGAMQSAASHNVSSIRQPDKAKPSIRNKRDFFAIMDRTKNLQLVINRTISNLIRRSLYECDTRQIKYHPLNLFSLALLTQKLEIWNLENWENQIWKFR